MPSYLRILSVSSPGATREAFDSCTEADFAYADGEYGEASRLYVQEIEAAPPCRPQPWAGLALALQRLHFRQEISSLLDHGEVVAHLHARLRSAGAECDPVRLTLWLSGTSGA
jgi:hypothetical protein